MPGASPTSLSAGLNARTGGVGNVWVPGASQPFIITLSADITIFDVHANVPHLCETSMPSPDKDRLLQRCGARLQSYGIFIPFETVNACAGDVEEEEDNPGEEAGSEPELPIQATPKVETNFV